MTNQGDARPFPIQAESPYTKHPPSFIPWWLAEIAYVYYAKRYGKDQSLERLAERGGFGRRELLILLMQHFETFLDPEITTRDQIRNEHKIYEVVEKLVMGKSERYEGDDDPGAK